jgi:hypothetical protein
MRLRFAQDEARKMGYMIYKINGEYRVKRVGVKEDGYFTSDLEDALATARAMYNETAENYGKTVTLSAPLSNVECWNMSNGGGFVLPAGVRLKVEHIYDAEHTTCMAEKELFPRCYRWIIRNTELNRVAGTKLPEKTRDIVGEIIRAES